MRKFVIHSEVLLDEDKLIKQHGSHSLLTEAGMKRALIKSLEKLGYLNILCIDVVETKEKK